MKIIKIKTKEQLVLSPKKEIKSEIINGPKHWTTTPLILKINGKEFITNKWLINNMLCAFDELTELNIIDIVADLFIENGLKIIEKETK